ncbi:hypothetical protein ES332_D01G238300v1 [Gossypium tomentosum]|uniref:Uncharacterized protein n=1 Tax=Gossypium tomentosum TaxID=34277 RepID=A0A5D2MCQ2_GOSTO|nr:hypothetical protein ES332_D01G238300v1 [Gossypium tomentosum]
MAGLQYNFFPTDFYYPRPQSLPDHAARVAAVAIHTPKKEVSISSNDLEWPRSVGFRVHQPKNTEPAALSMHQHQPTAFVEDQSKLVKYYPNPLSCFTFIPQHLSNSS